MRTRWALPLLVAGLALLVDQLAKAWVAAALPIDGPPLALLGGWLALSHRHNTGVAFGLFPDQGGLLSLGAVVILTALAYAYQRLLPGDSRWVATAIGLIFGGGLANLLDRLRQGYVVDFVQVGWWPIFNLADSAIFCGVAALAAHIIFVGDEPPPPPPTPYDDGLLRDLLGQDPGPPA